jgi:glycosyltransferase involved in cell wall biosynthesis
MRQNGRASNVEPRITVAIPTRNRAALLENALRSVLAQSLKDVEIFVSDNASTDATSHVVESFRDPRIHYAPLDRDVGMFENLSRCLSLGTAPYIALLTDDDRMFPGSLERRAAILDGNEAVDLVHSSFELVFTGPEGHTLQEDVLYVGGRSDGIEPGRTIVRRLLADGSYWINPATTLIRRSVIGDESFDPADGIVSDLGISLRFARRCRAVAYVAEPLSAVGVLADGDATRGGVYEFEAGAFFGTFEAVAEARRVKERFLRSFAADFPDLGELRTASRRSSRDEVLRRLTARSRRDHPPQSRLRLLSEAARAEPSILLTRTGARFLLGAIAGRAAAHALGRRLRSSRLPN